MLRWTRLLRLRIVLLRSRWTPDSSRILLFSSDLDFLSISGLTILFAYSMDRKYQ